MCADRRGNGAVSPGQCRAALCGLMLLLLEACATPPPAAVSAASAPRPSADGAQVSPTSSSPGAEGAEARSGVRNERSVYFAQRSAELDAAALAVLELHAVRLKENPRMIVTVVGHSAQLGSRSYNLAVAEQRVTAVVKALHSMGVPRNQIRRYSAGREMSANNCQTDACRQTLQRVDLVYPKPALPRKAERTRQ